MLGVSALVALVIGWSQPMPAAEAGFNSAATASSAVATHTLATPVLTCDPGGLLVTTVTLRWAAVSSATTADPHAVPANSTYLADGYVIERSTSGGAFTVLGTAARTATSYVDAPGGLLTTYKYQVRTTINNWLSPASNQATASVTSIVLVGVNTSCTA
jgi:hypothetical protein